jgi:dihydroorotase
MTGLETAVRVVHEAMVSTGLLDWSQVADRMSMRPAAIGRLNVTPSEGTGTSRAGTSRDGGDLRHGCPIAPGSPANLLLYDPACVSAVDPAGHASRSRNTPFAGMKLPGQVVATFLRGTPTVTDGRLTR